jgi:D-alanyl-D-alanine carboxypeptidase (penicillin-binding protein 5/6)
MRDAFVFTKNGEKDNTIIKTAFDKVKAPIKKGDKIGEIIVYRDGIEVDRVALLAEKSVKRANVWDRMRDIGRSWNAR